MAEIINLDEYRRRRAEGRIAARVSLRAHERGVGAAFDVAHHRLVTRWDRPADALETLSEAANVAGLKLDEVLDAAYDPRRDGDLAQVRRAR